MKFGEVSKSDKLEVEKEFLKLTRSILKSRIRDKKTIQDLKIDAFTLNKMLKLLDRMFDNEFDFLSDEPDEYLNLYCKDYLKN